MKDKDLKGQLTNEPDESLVKSKERMADHGEVFTPNWLVEEMCNLVKDESERIDSRFLEPACGSGNFLKIVLTRKLSTVKNRYSKSEFELKNYALFSLMCIYGIELLPDNVSECRENLLEIFIDFLKIKSEDEIAHAAANVLNNNIIQGDALSLKKVTGEFIEFPEWGYLGGGKFQRRDFRFEFLTFRSSIQGTLFETSNEHELFVPIRNYPIMRIADIANG